MAVKYSEGAGKEGEVGDLPSVPKPGLIAQSCLRRAAMHKARAYG